jgi:hydroxyethylthiazole kinase-like uncharacterized protein yjeF
MFSNDQIARYLKHIRLPAKNSHKGENGKLLIIGGSELFHAASAWSLKVASRIVDMVFYSSVPENNLLIQEAKKHFWDGVVVPRGEVENYLKESDCILIGPGMTRDQETADLTNHLLKSYPEKKWVIDAGALQMMDASLLNAQMIITPHHKEFSRVFGEVSDDVEGVRKQSASHGGVTIVLKGPKDIASNGSETVEIEGGNAGMTKGGTGDVLAGLIAALYCTHDAMTAAVTGSLVNKRAGEELAHDKGSYFNASDLADQIPETLFAVISTLQSQTASEVL